MFSREKTRNPNRSPANDTEGSGKSKESFSKARPLGGTKTSDVDVGGRRGGGGGRSGPPSGTLINGALPATPSTFSKSRRVRSLIRTELCSIGPVSNPPIHPRRREVP